MFEQDVLDGLAAGEVRRDWGAVMGKQAAEVDDALDAGAARGGCEVERAAALALGKVRSWMTPVGGRSIEWIR